MSKDYLKGKKCMIWSFMGNTRMHQALNNYGDRYEAVGIFTFEVAITGTITETGTPISTVPMTTAKSGLIVESLMEADP